MNKRNIKRLVSSAVLVAMIGMVMPEQGRSARAEENLPRQEQQNQEIRNIMYYGDWSIWGGQGNFYPKDIPAESLTHLNFSFLDFDAEGNLIFTDKDAAIGAPVGQTGVQWGGANAGILSALQELRERNPNLRLGVSVGGWSRSGDFSDMAANDESRARFVDNMMKFLEYTNMDYLDIDWEYPNFVREGDTVDLAGDEGTPNAKPEDKENYVKLLEDLRKALDEQGERLGKDYELSIALPVGKEKADLGLDIPGIFANIDFANVMSYDMRGAWDPASGHQTPLYSNPNDPIGSERNLSIDETVDYLIELGADPSKVVIGAAYYTRGWDKVAKGDNPELPGLFQPAEKTGRDADATPSYGAENEVPVKMGEGGRAAGVWGWRGLDDLKAKYPGLKEYWDDTSKAPYLYDETTGKFFTYDNLRSITEKANYVHEEGLGGIIGWQASNDKPTEPGSLKRDELTDHTKTALFGEGDLPDYEIVYSELDVTVSVTPYTQEWGTGGGYEITITNNETPEESDAVLKELEKSSETIKAPKLYIKSDGPLTRGDHMAGTVTYEGGYTVVDLKTVWEGKLIPQGGTYTFKLAGDAKIDGIDLVQRMSEDGPDMYRQNIYGEAGEVVPPVTEPEVTDPEVTPDVNTPPQIFGATNEVITVGENFDPMAGVTATDTQDGDLTAGITVDGTVDINTPGTYTVTYKVSDSTGLEAVVERIITVRQVVTNGESKFGVGYGIEWPAQVAAPFIDMVLWTTKEGYTNNGAPNLVKLSEESGIDFFNLGFIQSVGDGEVVDGKVKWGWGGYGVLAEGSDDPQYEGIKKSIRELRERGGDVTISLGGLTGNPIWMVTQDEEVLYNTYKEIVEGYGLTRMDLDVEGHGQSKEHNRINARAIKRVQEETGVDIVLTLPVLPSGLSHPQLDVLEVYLSEGVDLEVINVMTMCYGPDTLLPGENYGTASLRAVDSLKDQLKDHYRTFAGVELTDEQAYAKIGTTPSVGFETSSHPLFPTEYMDLVVDHAIARDIGMVSFWSMNRDAKIQDNKGIVEAYDFANIAKRFGQTGDVIPPVEGQNNAPVITGVSDRKLTVGDSFDPLSGVKATDKEDGDLTGAMVVTGEVNTNVAGVYKVTYEVSDKEGLKTTKESKVTVEEFVNDAPVLGGVANKTIYVGDAFDPEYGITAHDAQDGDLTKNIVIEGTVDTNAVGEYTLTYKVTDLNGLEVTAQRVISVIEKVTVEGDTYDAKRIYNKGEEAVYGGVKYTAGWYTQGEMPGQSEVWKRELNVNEDGSVEYVPGHIYEKEGQLVSHNGETYRVKWYTNSEPGSDESWELIPKEGAGIQEYVEGKVYPTAGEKVSYNGKIYQTNWWTTSIPGSDASWTEVPAE